MTLARFRPFTIDFKLWLTLVVLATAITPHARVAASTQPIVASDLLRIREVTSIDVSRTGSIAVYAVKSIAEDGDASPADRSEKEGPAGSDRRRWQYQSHLYLIDLAAADAQPRQLTSGRRFDTSPRLSPDGQNIAFVRAPSRSRPRDADGERTADDAPQIWILPVDGGEAWQLTNLDEGCTDPTWSPDGLRILATSRLKASDLDGSPTWPIERPRRAWNDASIAEGSQPDPDGSRVQIRAWLEGNADNADPTVITRLDFQDELSIRSALTFQHLFIFDVPQASSSAVPIKSNQSRRITSGFHDHLDATFTADGTAVLYAAKKPADRHPDRVLATDLWRITVDGGNDKRILALDGWTLSAPRPSRDGAVIAFLGRRTDEPAFRQTQLGMTTLSGDTASDPVWMTDEQTFPASINRVEWLGLTPGVIFTAAMRGGFPLMTVSPGLLQPATLYGEQNNLPVGVRQFASGGGAIVFSSTSIQNPCVLKVRDGRGVRLLHDLNEWVKDKRIVQPVKTEITRPDGTRIDAWLMEPAHREAGRKYPLCLQIHGGPNAMWGPGEFSMWHEFQLMCSRGFGVVYCNPRGSGGYGYSFQKANYQNWGEGPAGDVLAAVDHALLKDWVDADRLVITGGSYAGYLTAWVIAHDHRFKAAVAQRGVYDLATFFGEGNAWRLVQWAFGGNPYESRVKDIISRNSPFTHVARIRTPLLIMHASNDLRTGVSQSEMMYRALKEMNKPVEYVRYPNAGHDLSRTGEPRQRMDRLLRIIEFFERYVENSRTANTTR